MRNAIIPTSLFLIASGVLVWLESQASIERIKKRNVTVMQFEQESYEDVDKTEDNWLSSVRLQQKEYAWVEQFATVESLITSLKFLELNPSQQLMAKVIYAKKVLPTSPQQTVTLLKSLSLEQAKIYQTDFSLGLAYSRLGQTDLAIESYRRLLSYQPSHQGGAINLGLLLKGQKQYLQAIKVLQEAKLVSSGTKLAKVYSLLASCQEKIGRHADALSNFQKSIEYRPQHAASWLGYARMQAKNGGIYAEVVKNFERARRLNPEHYKPLLELGNYQLNHLDFANAVVSLGQAVERVPMQKSARRAYAWALYENKQFLKAKKQWLWLSKNEKLKYRRKFAKFMLEIIDDNDNFTSVEALTRQILKQKKVSGNLHNDFEYLLLLTSLSQPQPPVDDNVSRLKSFDIQQFNHLQFRAHWHLVNWFSQHGYPQQAIAELGHVQRSAVALESVEYKLSEIYTQLGQLEIAQVHIGNALLVQPQNAEFQVKKLNIHLARKEFDIVSSELSQLRRQHPEDSRLTLLAAELAWQTQRLDEAKLLYGELVKLDERNDLALYRLASIAHRQGDLAGAQHALNDTLLVNSEFIPARYLLAKIFCEQGRIAECKFQANKVLKLDNNHQKAKALINI